MNMRKKCKKISRYWYVFTNKQRGGRSFKKNVLIKEKKTNDKKKHGDGFD